MSTVTARITGTINGPRKQAQIVLLGAGGETITLPITSPVATYSNLEADWEEFDRPGLKPLNHRVGEKLRTAAYTCTLVSPENGPWDLSNTVDAMCKKIAEMCEAEGAQRPIAFVWGKFDSSLSASGHWHIDSCVVTSTWRQPVTNNVSQATLAITLKEASDLPIRFTATKPTTVKTNTKTSSPKTPKRKTYTVKSGDTAFSIAKLMYGSDSTADWRAILDANGITDPRKLKPGMVLIIPSTP